MAHGSAFEFGAPNSPWTSFYNLNRGFTNTSPLGPVGSTSSSPSQFYSGSPDSMHSFPSLISGVLQVVNGDSFGFNYDRLTPDPFNGFSYRECTCTDIICDYCSSRSRFQARLSNSHSPDYMISHSTSAGTPSPPLQISYPMAWSIIICDRHPDASNYYCQTCSKPVCGECGLMYHNKHITLNLSEAVDGAADQANQVVSDAMFGIRIFTEDLEEVLAAVNTLEQRSKQASEDVTSLVRRLIIALEDRERKILKEIERSKMIKMASLKSKDQTIRANVTKLKDTVERLSRYIEASKLTSNPVDLVMAKDKASVDVAQIRQSRRVRVSPEENWISFSGPDNIVLEAISNLGSIALNNPGPIGDRRLWRGRGASPPQQVFPVKALPLPPIPRGRPVPGNNFPIIIWSDKHSSYSRKLSVTSIGNKGADSDKLCRPWGVACDKEGHVLVADRSNNRIQVFREDGTFIRRFGSSGTGPGQFDRPAGLTVDGRRRIIVADKDNHRIQILTMEGVFLDMFGEKGIQCGQFNYPWDVATNSECQIVVSDTRNHRVQLFSSEGVFLRKFGTEYSSATWKILESPRGVAFTPEGNVAVTDFNLHRVVVIEADFSSAKILGFEEGGHKLFSRPQGLIVDDQGNFVVADSKNHKVQIFNKVGVPKDQFGGEHCDMDGYFLDRPSGIALTSSGRIAVVDFGHHRVVIV